MAGMDGLLRCYLLASLKKQLVGMIVCVHAIKFTVLIGERVNSILEVNNPFTGISAIRHR